MVVHSLGWGEAYRLGHHWVGEERLEQTILAGLERADPLIAALPPLLPEGSPFGFNLDHETRRAWIEVGEDVEAEPLVAGVLTAIRDK